MPRGWLHFQCPAQPEGSQNLFCQRQDQVTNAGLSPWWGLEATSAFILQVATASVSRSHIPFVVMVTGFFSCFRLQSGRCVSEREHTLIDSALILPWFCNVTLSCSPQRDEPGRPCVLVSVSSSGARQPAAHPSSKWLAARQGGEAVAISVQFLFPAEDSPGGQLLGAWTLHILLGCLRLGRRRGRSWHAPTVPVQPGVKWGRRPAACISACQDVWPVSLISGVQYLPPSARHGQQKDLSAPEGVHL